MGNNVPICCNKYLADLNTKVKVYKVSLFVAAATALLTFRNWQRKTYSIEIEKFLTFPNSYYKQCIAVVEN